MEPQNPPAPEAPARSRHRPQSASGRRRGAIIGIVVAVLLVYCGVLFAYWFFSASSTELSGLSSEEQNGSETVVLVTVQALRTVDYKLDVKVLLVPERGLTDERLEVLNTDVSVRLVSRDNNTEDLNFKEGTSPAQVSTSLDVDGDVNTWPFDSYTTEPISAEVLVGSGDERQLAEARVHVEGALQGWAISSDNSNDAVKVSLQRSPGPLAFNLGVCLVLITMPTLAIFTAFQVVTRRKEFQMPFLTWYAAMLFATVPLRNILPGAPPPGAWIDVALVLWVVMALVSAMAIYVAAWYKQVD